MDRHQPNTKFDARELHNGDTKMIPFLRLEYYSRCSYSVSPNQNPAANSIAAGLILSQIRRVEVEISTYPCNPQLHPLVAPHVSHFSQVPLRTMVKFWHSEHMLPVYP